MNQKRRKQISLIRDQLDSLKASIEEVRDDEQDAFNNLPENLQMSDKSRQQEDAASALDEAVNSLDEAMSSLDMAAE